MRTDVKFESIGFDQLLVKCTQGSVETKYEKKEVGTDTKTDKQLVESTTQVNLYCPSNVPQDSTW